MSTEPGPPDPPRRAPATASPPHGESRLSYSIISRHLSVLRDAASAILTHFARHGEPEAEGGEAISPSPPGKDQEPAGRKKNPLTARIERHTSVINRALGVTTRLNPGKLSRWELPQDVRRDLDWQDQVIRGVLDAEVHFWSAALERDPLITLDEAEESWLLRIIQLAAIVGCSPGNELHLAHLQEWRAARYP